jgi:hypothetical protein
MAEEQKGGSGPLGDALFILGLIVVLAVLWFATGSHNGAEVKGIFLHPPPPVGQGGAYGPTIGSTTIQAGAHY